MRTALRTAGAVLATLVGLLLLWLLRGVLISFLLSLAVAAAFRPTIEGLARRGLPRSLALALSYSVAILLLVALFSLAGGSLVSEVRDTAEGLATVYEQVQSEWPQGTPTQQAVASILPPPAALYDALAEAGGTAVAQALLGAATSIADVVSQFAIVLVLSIYWSASQVHFERLWLSLLRGRVRLRARETWREVERNVGTTIRNQVLLSVLTGLLFGVGYTLLGLGRPAVLALAGALLSLVPWFGTALAVVTPLVANVAGNVTTGLAGAAYAAAVLAGLSLSVRRLRAPRRADPLLAVVVLVVMARTFGLWGAVLALPVATVVQALVAQLATPPATRPESVRELGELRARLHATRGALERAGVPPTLQSWKLVARLDGLLVRTEACCGPLGNWRPVDETRDARQEEPTAPPC